MVPTRDERRAQVHRGPEVPFVRVHAAANAVARLQHHDLHACALEGGRGCEAGRAGANDDHLALRNKECNSTGKVACEPGRFRTS